MGRSKRKNQLSKTSGRTQLTEKLKNALLEHYGARCNLYGEEYPARLLQPDHRIPYEIGGDPENMMDLDRFMLLSPSANRDKSWACEHCENWSKKDISMCKECYYAYPENYSHIAGKLEKRVSVIFNDEDMYLYDELLAQASENGITCEEETKRMIAYYQKMLKMRGDKNKILKEDVSIMCNLSQKIKETGIETGIEMGKREMIMKMYNKGYTAAQIADVAEMDEEQIKDIIKNSELLAV